MGRPVSQSVALLGEAIRIRGELIADQTLHFDGYLEGDLVVRGRLLMGRNGHVKGRVVGADLSLAGRVEGDVLACGELEVSAGAEITGCLYGVRASFAAGSGIACRCSFGHFAQEKLREAAGQYELMEETGGA